MGRLLKLQEAITIEDCVSRVKKHLEIPFVRLALARKASMTKKVSISVSKIFPKFMQKLQERGKCQSWLVIRKLLARSCIK